MTETFEEVLFENFKNELKNDLNLYENVKDDEIKEILISIIKEYEIEFNDSFTDVFIYTYYKNLLKWQVIDNIINFVKTKESLKDTGKEDVIQAERMACQDVLYLFDFDFKEDSFVSNITGKQIPVNYKVTQIIENKNIFFRPPSGDPKLRGPHINFTIEYSLDYWLKFKEDIQNYIKSFESTHSEDFLEDLKDYRYWLNKYRIFENLLVQKNTLNYLKGGEKHVKN